MVFIKPLDLKIILINYFAGSWEVFYFLAVIVFAYLGARYRMPTQIFLILMLIFIVFMRPYFGLFFVLGILGAGVLIFYIMKKLTN